MGRLFYWRATEGGVTNHYSATDPSKLLVNRFKALCDAHPTQANYVSIGKSYEGRDIWMFRIGTIGGGVVLLDGCLHGWEDMGTECEYRYAKWLLESGDPKTLEILQKNYSLFVPVVNMDSVERQNRDFNPCLYGVDLNRNFTSGWTYTGCADYPNCYHGPSAASEPETLILKNVFQTYKPEIYLNTHYGGGPYLAYYSGEQSSIVQPILNRISQLSMQMGVTPYPVSSSGSNGYAIGDAHNAGAIAWLLETATETDYHTGTDPTPSCYMHDVQEIVDIDTYYFPKMLPIFIAFSEAVAKNPVTQKHVFTQWNDGDLNNPKTVTT